MKKWTLLGALALAFGVVVGIAAASTPGADVRLTHDENAPGYVSSYTLATGRRTPTTLDECSVSRGRQNEPAVGVDPRNTNVSSAARTTTAASTTRTSEGNQLPAGPIWLGYYRSENGGPELRELPRPGISGRHVAVRRSRPDPYRQRRRPGRRVGRRRPRLPRIRVLRRPGRDPKTFGDVWVAMYENPDGPDGDTLTTARSIAGPLSSTSGSSAPFLLGISTTRRRSKPTATPTATATTTSTSRGRDSPATAALAIYFSRSTDHGVIWSSPMKLSDTSHDVQFPDIAMTGTGTSTSRSAFPGRCGRGDAIYWAKSTDCGATFTRPRAPADVHARRRCRRPESAGRGGRRQAATEPPELRERGSTPARTATAATSWTHARRLYVLPPRHGAALDGRSVRHRNRERLHRVGRTKPGTEVATGTTYFTVEPGVGSQAGIYFIRLDGATGEFSEPALIDDQPTRTPVLPGHLGGRGCAPRDLVRHAKRPAVLGYTADLQLRGRDHVPCLDVYGTSSSDAGDTWAAATLLTDEPSNPNYEQYDDRAVPFIGDYTG